MKLLKEIYAKLLRVPVLGLLLGFIVRGTKRLLGVSTADNSLSLSSLGVAMGGFRFRLDDLNQRVEQLENGAGDDERISKLESLLTEQQTMLAQLSDYVELLEKRLVKQDKLAAVGTINDEPLISATH